jgi:hypothetical protein
VRPRPAQPEGLGRSTLVSAPARSSAQRDGSAPDPPTVRPEPGGEGWAAPGARGDYGPHRAVGPRDARPGGQRFGPAWRQPRREYRLVPPSAMPRMKIPTMLRSRQTHRQPEAQQPQHHEEQHHQEQHHQEQHPLPHQQQPNSLPRSPPPRAAPQPLGCPQRGHRAMPRSSGRRRRHDPPPSWSPWPAWPAPPAGPRGSARRVQRVDGHGRPGPPRCRTNGS